MRIDPNDVGKAARHLVHRVVHNQARRMGRALHPSEMCWVLAAVLRDHAVSREQAWQVACDAVYKYLGRRAG